MDEFNVWNHGGEYDGEILCSKHYQQLRKYGKIVPDKKNKCDVCGNDTGRLTQVGKGFPQYHGMTLCLRHYNQLFKYGYIKDNFNNIEEKNNGRTDQ